MHRMHRIFWGRASCPQRAAERKEYPLPSARLAGDGSPYPSARSDGSPYPSARSHGYDTRLARHGCRGKFSGLVSTAAGGGKASARRHAQTKNPSASSPRSMRFPRPPLWLADYDAPPALGIALFIAALGSRPRA